MSTNLKSTLSYQLFNNKKYYINNKTTLFDNIAIELKKVFNDKNFNSSLDAEYGLEAYKILNKLSNARKLKIKRCIRCRLPASQQFVGYDSFGICKACRSSEQKMRINWSSREKIKRNFRFV